ncbi:hypothetical protein Tco_0461593 [Tanacetum coccineum]
MDTKTPSTHTSTLITSAPNDTFKTPSTKDTSSSSIDYILKSPSSSTSEFHNGYLYTTTYSILLKEFLHNLQLKNMHHMDITLTFSQYPLDVQLILHHLHHLSLVISFLGTFLRHMEIHESKELIEKKIDWNKPPKEGDGAWHIKIELIDPDGEKFNRTFQSIPTTRLLSEKENPSEIIDLEHFHDS